MLAVVTGSSQGIGAAIAKKFLQDGWKVVLSARHETPFTKDLPADRALFVPLDLSRREGHQRLAERAAEFGGSMVDCWVNNLGYSKWYPLSEVTEENMQEMMELNLFSAFWGTQAAVRWLGEGGSIVNISSLAGKRGSANNSLYCAAKFGVNGMTQALAKELGPMGVRVNAVCPVYVQTENLLSVLKDPAAPPRGESLETYFDTFAKTQAALQRLPEGQEIAELVLYLSKAKAVTGQCWNIDCGVMPQ